MIIKLLTSLLFVATVLSIGSDITAESSCLSYSDKGYCSKWSISGRIEQDTAACFPETAKVMTPQGLKRMDELKKGDQVLASRQGKEVFTRLTSWFHHEKKGTANYLRVKVADSFFLVSHTHNILTEQLVYAFPEDLEGQSLFSLGKVESIEVTQAAGKFAPKTETNNFFVYLENSSEKKVLAHCFAEVRDPQRFEIPVKIIESVWNWFEDSENDVHPSYIWMHQTFTFLQG